MYRLSKGNPEVELAMPTVCAITLKHGVIYCLNVASGVCISITMPLMIAYWHV